MQLRLSEFKRILKQSGTLYVHCDSHMSHYIKVLADQIYGKNNFLNEIIWKRQSAHNDVRQGSRHFGRIHDSILVYTISKNYVWNQQFTPYDEVYVEQTYKFVESITERKYAVGDLTGPGGASKGNPMYEFLGVRRYWRYSKTKMLHLLEVGKIVHEKGKVPLLKRYLDEMKGKPLQDIWMDISPSTQKSDRFPTQKPEALLRRIIETSSNNGQVIYEPFAGSATAGAVCYKLLRQWIGSEISKNNSEAIRRRLNCLGCNVSVYPNNHESAVGLIPPQNSNLVR